MRNIFRKRLPVTEADEKKLKMLKDQVCFLESSRILGNITADEFECEMALIDMDLSKLEAKYE